VTTVGLLSPVVTRVPGQHSPWEVDATAEDLAEIAVAADTAGLGHLTCSQHAVVPTDVAATRGGTYWDPLATLSFLAARTSTIRLVTNVLVLSYQHPLMLAKQYATLDRLSRGRVVLGVGVGSLREEFDALAVAFEGRGAHADQALGRLRTALAEGVEGFVLDPGPVQVRLPIWVGGRSLVSLRRAIDQADGWMPFGLTFDELKELVQWVPPPAGFDVVLSSPRPLDPEGEPERASRALQRLRDAGATRVSVALSARSAAHYVEQVHGLAELVRSEGLG
jgi:probable F420-dependent oxidoreductase